MNAGGDSRRILSLDGGGTWALVEVKALMAVYPDAKTGHDILRRFDLAISNSGGSIVLAALALDMDLNKVLSLFEDEGARSQIFVNLELGPLLKTFGAGPRYNAAKKLDGLRAVLTGSPMRMSEWQLTNDFGREVRLVICGFDYERLREVFFRTRPAAPDEPPVTWQEAVLDASFAEAVHASSNAPLLYFNAPAEFGAGRPRFWDGAMGGYNNPVVAGVVEMVRDRTVDRAKVRVLSLGTGSVVLPEQGPATSPELLLPRRGESFLTYLKTAAGTIIDDPPDAASYVAHVMLQGDEPKGRGDVVANGAVVRMSPLVQPISCAGIWDFPIGLGEGVFTATANTDMDAVSKEEVDRIVNLADRWLAGADGDHTSVRNQPIRADRWLRVEIGHGTFAIRADRWLRVEIGHGTFGAARAAWPP